MDFRWLAVALVLILTNTAIAVERGRIVPSDIGWRFEGESRQEEVATLASVLELLTDPQSFDGKRVRVAGVLSAQFEDFRVYLSTEAYAAGLVEYSIDIDSPDGGLSASKNFEGKFVELEGMFSSRRRSLSRGILSIQSLKVLELIERP